MKNLQPSPAEHIHPHKKNRLKSERIRGGTIWITGLSGSGKSTTAYAIEASLAAQMINCYVLDGDNLRHGINRDLGFSMEDRSENIRRTAEIAKLFNDAGLLVVVSLISPQISDRQLARTIIGGEAYFEVFMSTPIEICEQRDPKDLYKKARLGQIPQFTGVSSPYQVPLDPDISVSAESVPPGDIAASILRQIEVMRPHWFAVSESEVGTDHARAEPLAND